MRANPASGGRLRLILIALIFAAPMVLAYVLYYSGWRPQAVHPYGELVTPARRIAEVELKSLDGPPAALRSTPPRWTLVYFGPSECTSACERALYAMRQVIAAQGKEAHRLRSVMVLTDTRALDMLRYQLKDYPDVAVLTGARVDIERLANEFRVPAGNALSGIPRIYVLDPLGNFVMSYPADADPSGMRKDLTRLLRYSQIG
jgi:cytochrome oxidase Cu insertion factor (SCO1/SenC/PrrC family)